MRVAELQAFVRGLAAPLTAAGAKQAATDLERAAACLEAFRDFTIAQWADFLAQAESYARTGVLSAGQRSRRAAPVADRSRVQAAAQLVLALSERAVAEDLAYTAIDAEIKKLGKLTKDEVLNLA